MYLLCGGRGFIAHKHYRKTFRSNKIMIGKSDISKCQLSTFIGLYRENHLTGVFIHLAVLGGFRF